eukprot:6603947-Pyramimonas_sp.AAC.1
MAPIGAGLWRALPGGRSKRPRDKSGPPCRSPQVSNAPCLRAAAAGYFAAGGARAIVWRYLGRGGR